MRYVFAKTIAFVGFGRIKKLESACIFFRFLIVFISQISYRIVFKIGL